MSHRRLFHLIVACHIAGLLFFSTATQAQSKAPVSPVAAATGLDLNYADDAAARAVWKPMGGVAAVSVVDLDGRKTLKLPCNFAGSKTDRAYWDLSAKVDLTFARGLQFQVYCTDLSPIGFITIYLHSGKGWYSAHFSPSGSNKWTTCTLRKNSFRTEDTPGGWGTIDTIRISAWRGGQSDTSLYLRDLALVGGGGSIAILQAEGLAKTNPDEAKSALECAEEMGARLESLGLDYSPISDLDLTADALKDKKLIILPHNPHLPDAAGEVLAKYLQGGGKMLCFYALPNRLAPVVGIEPGTFMRQKHDGQFASIRPLEKSSDLGLPAVTEQHSWNIMAARLVEGRSRVAAWWYDKDGNSTGLPAIVESNNCVLMTHVMLADNPAGKSRMLMAMIGQLAPDLWKQVAQSRIERIGMVGPYKNLADARKQTGLLKGSQLSAVNKMDEAETLQASAKSLLEGKHFAEAIETAQQASQAVIAACCQAQQSAKGEHRAFWCHSAFGVGGMEWDGAIKLLADNGFNAILPNMLWGGCAFYESNVLPVAGEVKTKGDQIAACLAACKKYGVACHVWKVNWNLGWNAPREFVDRMRREGRLQMSSGGKEEPWLCPSNPANQKLEIDSMVEVATRYEVDGIHFDYIRYPGNDHCFCPGCRERFEKVLGQKIARWPADVRREGTLRDKWNDFRRSNITTVVAGVSEQVRKARPKVKISAAVFSNWEVDRDGVAQDWKLWCDKGYMDFVCPMDYTPNSGQFATWVSKQKQWAGKVPCYPGIGVSCWGSEGDIFTLLEEIDITRKAGLGGFTIFNYDVRTAKDYLPLCGMGITRKAQ